MFGVIWNILYGHRNPDSYNYAFCSGGPYCPQCTYEMEPKKGALNTYEWKCNRCGNTYRCPDNKPKLVKEKVEKFIEAEIRNDNIKLDTTP